MHKKIIECECFTEGLVVDIERDDKYQCLILTTWAIGKDGKTLPWHIRLYYAWLLLTQGRVFIDELIFDKDGAYELADEIRHEASKLNYEN